MEKIAVFSAGNENIFFPALVTLTSIRDNNRNYDFDYYLCFSGATKDKLGILDKYKIKYIDTKNVDLMDCKTSDDRDIVHPIEVLVNYYVPNVLYELGYDYSIKVDWDLLCLNSWNIEDIIKTDRIVSCNYFGLDIKCEGVPAAIFEKTDVNYFNVGFFAASLKQYYKEKIFNKFISNYKLLTSLKNISEPEQLSFCLSLQNYSLGYIPNSYNLKITNTFNLREISPINIKNIHFCSHNKPWKQVKFERFKSYGEDKINLFKFRNLWLNCAGKIDEVKDFVNLNELKIINEYFLRRKIC